MTAIFPSTPSVGDTVTIENIKYRWTGTTWSIVPGAVQNGVVQSNNGAIDLSKGSYHKILIDAGNAAVTVSFSNVPSGSSKWSLELNTNVPESSYDLANASYDNVSFSVNAQDTAPQDIFFRSDGLKMYITGTATDSLYEYSLSTAWNVSTASLTRSLSIGQLGGTNKARSPNGLFFKPDGLKMFIVNMEFNTVNEYNLSTAWNISTVTYLREFSVLAQDSLTHSVYFRNDGLKMYTIGASNDRVYEYNLGTAWNVSTASYLQFFGVIAQVTNPTGIHFHPDGTRLYITGTVSDSVHEYILSTPWNISSASYLQSFSVAAQASSPTGIFFKDDGLKLYVLQQGVGTVYQYTTGVVVVLSLTWPASITWKQNTPPTITSDQNLILDFYTPDGGTTIYSIESINKDNTV